MPPLLFYKMHGNGNDFIVVDNRRGAFAVPGDRQREVIRQLCARHTGIGADGMILLEAAPQAAFYMRYYNADGGEGSFCGNGSRCASAFARLLGIVGNGRFVFRAVDGEHRGEVLETNGNAFVVSVSLNNPARPRKADGVAYRVDTGSPHLVLFVTDVAEMDVYNEGRRLRHDATHAPDGINVNFVEALGEGALRVRTFERGVERETLSCGSGAAASAIAAHVHFGHPAGKHSFRILTPGGELTVGFLAPGPAKPGGFFDDIVLTGGAAVIFRGEAMHCLTDQKG